LGSAFNLCGIEKTSRFLREAEKGHENISRSSNIVDRQDLLREKTGKWACIPLPFVIGYLQSSKRDIYKDLFLSQL
jgi:hypothetical protein